MPAGARNWLGGEVTKLLTMSFRFVRRVGAPCRMPRMVRKRLGKGPAGARIRKNKNTPYFQQKSNKGRRSEGFSCVS